MPKWQIFISGHMIRDACKLHKKLLNGMAWEIDVVI